MRPRRKLLCVATMTALPVGRNVRTKPAAYPAPAPAPAHLWRPSFRLYNNAAPSHSPVAVSTTLTLLYRAGSLHMTRAAVYNCMPPIASAVRDPPALEAIGRDLCRPVAHDAWNISGRVSCSSAWACMDALSFKRMRIHAHTEP